MVAFDHVGSGEPLLLLHGTTSSRLVWRPLLDELARHKAVFAVDLPGHGDSPPTSHTPPAWARELAAFLDSQRLERVAVVGHSAGGWTALELAKLGRTTSVLALAPAGLWRKRSPLFTDLALNANWRLGRALGPRATGALRSPAVRSLALRSITAKPRQVPAHGAIENARVALATPTFPEHFAQTRRLRFEGGASIETPIAVVWGGKDRIALQHKSRNVDELPHHAQIDTWADCGHMLMWDAPERVSQRILEVT